MARPLPVEYLLIDIPAAFPKEPTYRFNENLPYVKTFFPIENRSRLNEIQVRQFSLIYLIKLLSFSHFVFLLFFYFRVLIHYRHT